MKFYDLINKSLHWVGFLKEIGYVANKLLREVGFLTEINNFINHSLLLEGFLGKPVIFERHYCSM